MRADGVGRRAASGLLSVGLVGTALGVAFVGELVHRGFIGSPIESNDVMLGLVCILGPAVIGLLTWRQRRAIIGPLLTFAAGAMALGFWRYSAYRWPSTLGMAAFLVAVVAPLHVVLARPYVRPAMRRAAVALQCVAAAVGIAALLTTPDGFRGWVVARFNQSAAVSDQRARSALTLVSSHTLSRVLIGGWWAIVLGVTCAGVAHLVLAWSRAPAAARRDDAPLIAASLLLPVGLVAALVGTLITSPVRGTQVVGDYLGLVGVLVALAVLACAVGWIELVRPRLGRARAGVLELRPEDLAGPQNLAARLADLLGDPTVHVLYRTPDGWVESDGRPVGLPAAGEGRAVTRLARNGEPVAALVHDRTDPPETVGLAAQLTAASIDAERAAALARARAEAARATAARLVHAGDAAAEELEARLADEPIRDLAALARALRDDPSSLNSASAELTHIAGQVRTISHGVFPADLAGGLRAALADMRRAPDRRFAQALEMTAYLLAVDDPEATILDRGDTLVVTRARPAPQSALDRVLTLGGQVTATGSGVVAEIPVVSA